MLLQVIEAALNAPDLVQNWRDTLAEWPDATPDETREVFGWAISLRDQFLEAAREIDDPETLDMVLAIRYIELKSHWILLNTQLNYSMVIKGYADQSVVYRASLVSQLLAVLEQLIDDTNRDRIIAFLTEPILS